MERVTAKQLRNKVELLSKRGLAVSLDHMQPGDAVYTWAVETPDGSRRIFPYRMKTAECMAFLEGMLAAADMLQQASPSLASDREGVMPGSPMPWASLQPKEAK